ELEEIAAVPGADQLADQLLEVEVVRPLDPCPYSFAVFSSSATKIDLATRQFAPSAFFPMASQPSTYRGQCDATHSGSRKLAEIGCQPRFAASVTPFECGATAVTT